MSLELINLTVSTPDSGPGGALTRVFAGVVQVPNLRLFTGILTDLGQVSMTTI